jgi:hypothetical protein
MYAKTTMRTVHSIAQHHEEVVARLDALLLSQGPPDAPRDVDGTAWFGGVGLVSSESLEASSAVMRGEVSLDMQVYRHSE